MHTFAKKPKPSQQTTSAKSTKPSRPFFGQSRDVQSILRLQRTVGNLAVQGLLQTNTKELKGSSAATASTFFAHDFNRIHILSPSPVQVQPKLTVS